MITREWREYWKWMEGPQPARPGTAWVYQGGRMVLVPQLPSAADSKPPSYIAPALRDWIERRNQRLISLGP